MPNRQYLTGEYFRIPVFAGMKLWTPINVGSSEQVLTLTNLAANTRTQSHNTKTFSSTLMSSLIRFHYDPFTEFDRLFYDAFNARSWPSTSRAQRLDSFRPR